MAITCSLRHHHHRHLET
ncbi:hypothetical protein SNE40_002432 [Patella caerulea]|uniref:Uncharacterized protein n=1 Tax=Patella caerulea TaxID=87958 RepID=A0AAN8K8C3_PATCE